MYHVFGRETIDAAIHYPDTVLCRDALPPPIIIIIIIGIMRQEREFLKSTDFNRPPHGGRTAIDP